MKSAKRRLLVLLMVGLSAWLVNCLPANPGHSPDSNEASNSDPSGDAEPCDESSVLDEESSEQTPPPPTDDEEVEDDTPLSDDEEVEDDTTPIDHEEEADPPNDETTPAEDTNNSPPEEDESESEESEPTFFPAPNNDFGGPGGFEAESISSTGPSNRFSVYYPTPLGRDGIKHPIITWGNGTSAVPAYYSGLLHHLASHGFIVIASKSTNTGSGVQMLQGVDWVIGEDSDPQSIFYGVVQTDAVCATGHSQGGGGTVNAANDSRVRCSAPIQPTQGQIGGVHGPMLVLAGSLDTIIRPEYAWAGVYEPAQVPAIWGNLIGATHFTPLGSAGDYRWVVTAWFRHHLYSDPAAEPVFFGDDCSLCSNDDWEIDRKNW